MKFGGFPGSCHGQLAEVFRNALEQELVDGPLATGGQNWGDIGLKGNTLLFKVGDGTAFEIPLSDVSSCSHQKNEVTVKFHEYNTVDTKLGDSLTEMRLFVSPTNHKLRVKEDEELDSPAHKLQQIIQQSSGSDGAAGQGIVQFHDIRVLVPRNRYEVEFYPTYLTLHGKSSDLKILYDSVTRIHYLPRMRNHLLILSLHPPLRKGATPYSHLVAEFPETAAELEELPVTLRLPELEAKYQGQLPQSFSGPVGEAFIKVCSVLMGKNVVRQGTFRSAADNPYVRCSVKANDGFLYFLERALFFVIKPAIYIRFSTIDSLEFTRVSQSETGSTKNFDLKITLKTGGQYEFNSLAKAEYSNIYKFISDAQIRIKGTTKSAPIYSHDDDDDEDEEDDEDDEEYQASQDDEDDD